MQTLHLSSFHSVWSRIMWHSTVRSGAFWLCTHITQTLLPPRHLRSSTVFLDCFPRYRENYRYGCAKVYIQRYILFWRSFPSFPVIRIGWYSCVRHEIFYFSLWSFPSMIVWNMLNPSQETQSRYSKVTTSSSTILNLISRAVSHVWGASLVYYIVFCPLSLCSWYSYYIHFY